MRKIMLIATAISAALGLAACVKTYVQPQGNPLAANVPVHVYSVSGCRVIRCGFELSAATGTFGDDRTLKLTQDKDIHQAIVIRFKDKVYYGYVRQVTGHGTRAYVTLDDRTQEFADAAWAFNRDGVADIYGILQRV